MYLNLISLNPPLNDVNNHKSEISPKSPSFLGNPTPTVTLNVPSQSFVGQNVNFTATFNNTGALADDTGYAPFIDLYLPTTGGDGDGDGLGTTSISASYLGTSITPLIVTFPPGGTVNHPYSYQGPTDPSPGSPFVISGTPGDKLVVIPLPFGSFTRDQPELIVDLSVDMSSFANVGEALTIRARGGYRYGGTAINDWCCLEGTLFLPPGNNPITDWPGYPVIPTIMQTSKAYTGPESELPTGPNFDGNLGSFGSYTITTTIAPGQTVTDLTITDILPNNIAYTNLSGSSGADTGTGTAVLGAPGGTIIWNFGSVSGTATLTVDFFAPLNNASAAPVLIASTGDDGSATNAVSSSASWTPLDGDDPAGPVTGSCPTCAPVISLESISTQKSVTDPIPTIDVNEPGHTPGDTLTYTINFQVSDFFAFENLVITDVLNDGQCFIPGSSQLTINEHSGDTFGPVAIVPSVAGADTTAPVCADTTLTFDISTAMTTATGNGQLLGGCIPSGGTAGPTPDCSLYNGTATSGIVTFTAMIQEDYSAAPSGDTSVDHNDTIGNSVDIAGDVLNVNTLVTTGNNEADGSTTSIRIIKGVLTKSIYGYNTGSGCVLGSPGSNPLSPGDEITYRLVYTLPSSDTEYLHFTDYLPLPVLDADELTPPPLFDTTISAACPAAGTAKFGPTDTFFATSSITPAIIIDSNANSVTFDYGPEYDGDATGLSTVDILFTVTISDDPFADQLLLTNQARVSETNSFNTVSTLDGIIQFVLGEPVLTSTKSVIAHSSTDPTVSFTGTSPSPIFSLPGSGNPRWAGQISAADIGDAGITGLDGSDWASFALMVTNSGSSPLGAFDITISDTLMAPDFVIPTIANLNLSVTYADGTPVPFTGVADLPDCTGSGDETDPCGPDGVADTDDDLFGYGIEITDPGPAVGACQAAGHPNGHDLIIITYDLQINPNISPQTEIINTGSLNSYTGAEGGPNHLSAPDTDTSTVTTASPSITKTITGTNQTITAGNDVVVGEIVNYQVVITIPEGQSTNTTFVDTLDSGLAFVDPLSGITITPSLGGFLTITDPPNPAMTFNDVRDAGLVTLSGTRLEFDFHTLTNSNTDNSTPETITFEYQVVVLNTTDAVEGSHLNNNVVWSWDTASVAGGAPVVTVREPSLNVVKLAAPDTADAGDTITYSLTVTYDGSPLTTAFDVILTDTIPAGLTYTAGTLDCTGGTITPDVCDDSAAPTFTVEWTTTGFPTGFGTGDTSVITFDVTVDGGVLPGEQIDNNALITWTSLPDDISTGDVRPEITTYNTDSVERNGEDGAGGVPDDYAALGPERVTIFLTSPEKTIVQTSETFTGVGADTLERVAIGEIVRYHLSVRLAESTIPDFQIRDNIPAGMMFLNDGTTTVGLVSNDSGITSSTLAGAGLNIFGNTSAPTPTFSLPGTAISSSMTIDEDIYGNGTDVYFKFGDLVNLDRDLDFEYAILEFNALVLNVASNQAFNNATGAATPTQINNDFDVFVNGIDLNDTSVTARVRVAEPVLTIDKSNTTGSAIIDAGDAVQYTLVITNTSSGDDAAMAYDLNIIDTLDANLILSDETTDIAVSYSGAPSPFDVSASNDGGGGDDEINVTIDFLEPGETATIVIDLVLADNTVIALVVNNESTVTYTSLEGNFGNTGNGTGSDTTGNPGDTDGERTGSGVGSNDYTDTSAVVQFTLSDPAVLKTVTSTSAAHTTSSQGNLTIPDLVIGETVTFQLTATIPEGYAAPTTITDNLPLAPGRLAVVSHCVVSIGGSLSGPGLPAIPFCPNSYGIASDTVADANNFDDQVVFSFGNVQNTPDGISNAGDQIIVQVVALLVNHVDNQSPDLLTNTARIDAGSGNDTNTADVEIVESNLTINKNSTVILPVSGTAILGATIEYNLALSNPGASSSATAFDIVLTDTIPSGMTYVAASITAPAGWTADDLAAPLLTWTSNAGIGLALNATVNFSYQATIDDPGMPATVPTPGDILTNAVNLTWTSLDGPSGEERDGSDGPGGALDDYANTTDDDVTVENIDMKIEKDDRGVLFSAGDTLIYDLSYYNDGSINATGVVITETVPVDTTFDMANSSGVWSCADNSPAGTTCTQSLGVVAPGGPTVVQFAVTIDNPLPAGVTAITNDVSIADDGTNGPEPTLTNNSDSIITPSIDAAPDLTITKSDGLEIVAPGAHMVYGLVYENVGSQDATGVVITETVSTGVTFDLGNSTAGWVVQATSNPAVDGEPAGTVLEYVIGNVNAGDAPVTVNFAVVVDNPLAPGITAITNTASIADDGTNGPDVTPGDNSDDDTDQVADTITKTITASNLLDTIAPEIAIGEVLTYDIVLTIAKEQ